ncbi:site-specific DNA recombinase [Aneurinibacillus soli]|uniref:DNA-invertase hin n=1 Tax=Aneurinibacillus soli TaxID=1500254 RepID=A0A0U5BB75_9BACL|nr:recombinase family protein [Aneurinibacillus soli]PYE64000.1 site-specific DNA recombinase [Aneurinibacillus soli]BAU27949.1 DNA-invertase hin [Aneurinibacillus soli]
MRVAIYVRVSTDEQAKEGFSIPAQKARLTQYVQSQDWDIFDYYIEEGVSAKDTNRPELQRMMHDISHRKVDIVLVYRLDRLTRSVLDLYQLLQDFEKHGVKFKSATEVYDTTSAIGRLFLTLVAALAQWERENLAERVRFGMEQMARQERRPGGPPPFGFELVNQKLVINEKEAVVVRFIYDRYLQGTGMVSIAVECNQLGYRTKKGNEFKRTAIFDILNNPAYYGALRWNYKDYGDGTKLNASKDWILLEGVYPAIIEKETFEQVQLIMQRKRSMHPRQVSSTYVFSGLLRCARCGGSMVGHTVSKKSGYVIRQYLCQNVKFKKCNCPALTDYFVEEAFTERLDQITDSYSTVAKTTQKSSHKKERSEQDRLEAEVKKMNNRRKRLQIAFSEGLIELEELREGVGKLQEQEASIKQKLKSYGVQEMSLSQEELIEIITNTRRIWPYATPEEKKHIVYLLVKRMIVNLPDEQRKNRKNKQVEIIELTFN